MNVFLTTVVAGVIVAVIGAVAAYYFGGLRARQQQDHQRERDEQIRQAERQSAKEQELEERQEELNERRAEGFSNIRTLAHSVSEALEDWTEKSATVPAEVPKEDREYRHTTFLVPWEQFFRHIAEVSELKTDVSPSISNLRTYYREQKPYLEPTSIRAFESFDAAITRRYAILSELWDDFDALALRNLIESLERSNQRRFRGTEPGSKRTLGSKWGDKRNERKMRQSLQEITPTIAETIQNARRVDLRKPLATLDAEADRLAHTAKS